MKIKYYLFPPERAKRFGIAHIPIGYPNTIWTISKLPEWSEYGKYMLIMVGSNYKDGKHYSYTSSDNKYKTFKLVEVSILSRGFKDVTAIYNKIEKLSANIDNMKLNTVDYTLLNKLLHKIIHKGLYPSKDDFLFMNLMYSKKD